MESSAWQNLGQYHFEFDRHGYTGRYRPHGDMGPGTYNACYESGALQRQIAAAAREEETERLFKTWKLS